MSCGNETLRTYLHPGILTHDYLKRAETRIHKEQTTLDRHLSSIDDLRRQTRLNAQSTVDIECAEIQFHALLALYSSALVQFKSTIYELNSEQITSMLVEAGLTEARAKKWVMRTELRLKRRIARYEREHGVERIENWFGKFFGAMKKTVERRQANLRMQAALKLPAACGEQTWAEKEEAVRGVVKQGLVVVFDEDEKVNGDGGGDEDGEGKGEVDVN